uniref:L1 transposable element RRM domain-containing protein n=1 Tax=Equus caballus TaxID=9796 RepID=A0A9L0SE42_HORSE
MFQIKEQDSSSGKELNETEINNLSDKEYKLILIRMLTDLGKRIDEFSENINKELENIKKGQVELKNTIMEMSNSLEGNNSRVDDTKECISDLNESVEESTQAEWKKEKRVKMNKDSLRDLWGNIKHTNIHIIVVLEGKERDKGAENLLEEIIAENFPNLGKETDVQVEEVQRAPNKMNPKRTTPRHIIIKMSRIKDKEKILKAARERQQVTYKGNPIRLSVDCSSESLQARMEWHDILKVLKVKTYNQEYST